MKSKTVKFVFLLILAAGILFLASRPELRSQLSLEGIKESRARWLSLYEQRPALFMAGYFAIYVLTTALSIPGATVLTLAGGFLFGFTRGLVLISFASTIGATLAFLISRFLLRDWVQGRFGDRIRTINQGVEKEGPSYLFALRLIPAFPFFLVNLVMGLTPIKTWTFYWVSQVGMLPGTLAYVNAGTQLGQLQSLKGIVSPTLLFSFAILGLLPWLSKRILAIFRRARGARRFKKPGRFDYNLVVIGAGAAGLVSAYIATTLKAKVALIEKNKMGGDCLYTGCVPSKALIKAAKLAHDARQGAKFGVHVAAPRVEFREVMARIQESVRRIEPHDSVERYTALGVECISGHAKILSPYEVQVGQRILTTRSIVIAAGAEPVVPRLPGLEEAGYLTSETLWDLQELPERLLVLGAGPIGCELGQSFQRLGSLVTLVDQAPRILGKEDLESAEWMRKRLLAEGVRIELDATPLRVEKSTQGNVLICERKGAGELRIEFDRMLIALGRRARTAGYGLEALGVDTTRAGTVQTDEYLATVHPNIYVCGDAAGPYQFTHYASHSAWFATVNALFRPLKRFKLDLRVIPWATFTDPEIARVGLTEQEARDQGIDYEVTCYELDDLDRAIVEGADHGFVKVLTPRGKDRILGVTLVGAHAGEWISEFVFAMKHELGLGKVLTTPHIYPTLAEANRTVAGQWRKAHAPQHVLTWLEKLHAWRRG